MVIFISLFYPRTRHFLTKCLLVMSFLLCLNMLSGCSGVKDKASLPEQSEGPALPHRPIHATPLTPPTDQLSTVPHVTRTVGVLLPLTGEHQPLGESLLQAIELSLLEDNTHQVALIIQDTKGTDQGARTAMSALFQKGPVDCILGPLFANEVSAITPLAWEKGVPVLSFSNGREIAGNNVFIMGYSPKDQTDVLLDYASDHGFKSILLIVPHSAYGNFVSQTVRQKITTLPVLKLFDTLTYGDPSSLGETISRIDFSLVDGIFIPEGGETLLAIVQLLGQNSTYGRTQPKLLGSGQWDDEKLFSQSSLRGGIFPSTSIQAKENFKDKFLKIFGVFPERLSALGYDGMKVLGEHLSQSVLETLLSPQGFEGADGHFSFSQSGHISRNWQIYEISPSSPQGVVPLTSPLSVSSSLNPVSLNTSHRGTY